MKNNIEKLKEELNYAVKDSNVDIDKILRISNKIDREIETVYLNN